jgi:hypothetical protein
MPLYFCLSRTEIVRKDVETILGISQAMAVRLLHGLVGKGVVHSIGGGRNTRYKNRNWCFKITLYGVATKLCIINPSFSSMRYFLLAGN